MNFGDVPIGFGMALAQNEAAVNAYAMMTQEQKDAVLGKVRQARSKAEMRRIVAGLAEEGSIQ